MSSSTRQQDLLDCTADGRTAARIDQVDSATDEEELLSDSDSADQSDELRVEDEDWEIAERGLSFFFVASVYLRLTPFSFGRLH
jgi:hypothetical protein